VLRIFRANGLLLAAGDRLAVQEGLSSARWQVLGAVAPAGQPLTVPQIARRMGLTRQSVQASVNRLHADALVAADENPGHRRSRLIRLTELGSATYARLQRRQTRWIGELADGLDASELAGAARVLQELSDGVDGNARSGGSEQ
jgi:DNA-binding MarR family transcriptional regulator